VTRTAAALPDVLTPGLAIVFCGTAAGQNSAVCGAYYAGPGNGFWPTLHAVGLTPRRFAPADFTILPTLGLGMTDLAKYRAGNDDVLHTIDFDVPAFVAKIREYAPRAIAFNGKRAAAVYYGCSTRAVSYGVQPSNIGTTSVWVLPSTSASARAYWDLEPWDAVARFAKNYRGSGGAQASIASH
jgi:TDG/mug DNA glycosylase family protein